MGQGLKRNWDVRYGRYDEVKKSKLIKFSSLYFYFRYKQFPMNTSRGNHVFPLFHSSTLPLHHSSTLPLFYFSTIPLKLNNCSTNYFTFPLFIPPPISPLSMCSTVHLSSIPLVVFQFTTIPLQLCVTMHLEIWRSGDFNAGEFSANSAAGLPSYQSGTETSGDI